MKTLTLTTFAMVLAVFVFVLVVAIVTPGPVGSFCAGCAVVGWLSTVYMGVQSFSVMFPARRI